ncbi:MAG: YafY family transcriptional regulator [Anaerolineae bacterium]|nr:YafY family transcriptional regulator [Anaerolineae bacterium]
MRADRLVSIVMLLQARGRLTAALLARELGVSRRTILRDVEALSFAGIPIYAQGGHEGGIALDEGYRTTLTGLNQAEVQSLFVGNHAQLLRDVGLGDAAEGGLLKLLASVPAQHQPSIDYIRQRILIDPLWWWHDTQPTPYIAELQRAVYEDRLAAVVYENHEGEVTERTLEPYSLVAKSSLWYLIARHDGAFKMYRLSRFHRVTLLDTHFTRQPDFDLERYWHEQGQRFLQSAEYYTFTLRIEEGRLGFIRWLTPGRFEIVAASAGWSTVEFKLESIDLAKMLVFGLGAQAEVVAPDSLREAVVAAAQTVLRMHEMGNEGEMT